MKTKRTKAERLNWPDVKDTPRVSLHDLIGCVRAEGRLRRPRNMATSNNSGVLIP
jgi:hypothetical protein